jgi:hypothetical protein
MLVTVICRQHTLTDAEINGFFVDLCKKSSNETKYLPCYTLKNSMQEPSTLALAGKTQHAENALLAWV